MTSFKDASWSFFVSFMLLCVGFSLALVGLPLFGVTCGYMAGAWRSLLLPKGED